MFKKKAKSVVAILLSLVMCFGMVPAAAFADETDEPESKEVNLLVFGNSTSNGYRMPGFDNGANGFTTKNNYLERWAASSDDEVWTVDKAANSSLGRMAEAAYPWQLKKYICDAGTDPSKCKLIPFCLNGMRTDELRAFLDEDFYNKAAAREEEYSERWDSEHGQDKNYAGFLRAHMGWYLDDFWKDGLISSGSDYEGASQYIKDQVADADVIVVDVCNNNFGTYVGYRLSAFLGINNMYATPNTYETLDDVDDLSDSMKKRLNSLKNTLASRYEMLSSEAGQQLLDTFLYGTADCIVNFKAEMDYINAHKKDDAKVIVVGLSNMLKGLALNNGGSKIDLGEIGGTLFDLVNTYIKTFDSNANNYYYADISNGYETFSSTIGNKDSFADVLADGDGTDGKAKYAIEMMYDGFLTSFMGGKDGDSKTIYEMIQSGIKQQAPAATFTAWNDLANDNTMITFDPGTFYLTVDQEKLAQAGDVDGVVAALGFSQAKPAADALLTKEIVKRIAAMYGASQLSAEQQEALTNMAIADGCTTMAQIKEWIINYCYQNLQESDIQYAYGMIQDGVKSQAPNANSFSALSDTEGATFKPGAMYVTYNTKATSLLEAFNYSMTPDLSEEDQQNGIVILTKGIIKQITANTIKPVVQEMLYDAVHEHNTLDFGTLVDSLGQPGGMEAVAQAITDYISAKFLGGEASLEEAYWGLLTLEIRFLLYDGVGEHPNYEGCDQKFQAVLKAYESEETAYDIGVAEIKAKLNELLEMLRNTGARDDIDAIIAKIAEVQAAMDMLDEAQASMEELKELQALKARLEEYFQEALDLLGITVDDLIAQGQFIADNVDPVWLAEQIKMMSDIINNWPELSEEYKAQLEEYTEKIMERVNAVIDELIRQKELFEDSETLKKIIETIELLREAVQNMPKSEEEFKEFALDKLDKVLDLIEDKAAEVSEDLAAEIAEIRELIDKAVTEGDYQALIDKLLPIGEKLLAIGEAVSDLPEYRDAMDAYMEASQAAMDGLEERVSALEQQMGKLTAKSIEVELKTRLTFPKKKAKVTLSWELDEDAAGYDVKVNGKSVEPYETKTGMAYDQTSVTIGKKYTYKVTPYIYYEINGKTEKISGSTVTKTFVPRVKVKKAALKKVKAAKKAFKATWKKVNGANGYKLSYKLGKKTQTKTVKSAKKVSLTVKKLKAGKTYTVKVRAFKTVNGKKYYGAWSKAKKVKVK